MLTPSARPRLELDQSLPEFDLSKLPKEEHIPAFELQSAMRTAARFIQAFDDAVALFEYCNMHIAAAYEIVRASKVPGKSRQHENIAGYAGAWQHIAARDAPISLWNFAQMLAEIRSLANGCPAIKGAVNWREVEGTLKDFHITFPFAWESRVGSAHAADIRNKPERNATKGKIHSGGFKVDGGSLVITDSISGNKAVATVDGQLVECEVSSATVAVMQKILQRLFDAFRIPALCRSRR
jgi:hypothetical protein